MIRERGRNRFDWLLAAICALVTTACGVPDARSGSIVLITIDTLRADHLGCYGYFRDTSPTLDRLAREGVLFENVVTPMATTLPSHVSLMTSTEPRTHGIKGNFALLKRGLSDDLGLVPFAMLLRGLGYRTAGFVSAAALKDHTGIQTGFEIFDQPGSRERSAADTTDRAIEWLGAETSRPFFLWVHYFDPHDPYEPPQLHAEAFRSDANSRELLRRRGVSRSEDPVVQGILNLYDAEVLYVDTEIARLFEALEEAGDWNESAIAVTADHGEGLGQHDWIRHGRIHNEQLFVPLILRLPGSDAPRGVRRKAFASLVDVVPTLVAALGLDVPSDVSARFEGVDLLADSTEMRSLFSERVERQRKGWEPGPKYALTNHRWKYFHIPEGEDELYDMLEDRLELHDVIAQNPKVASEMRREILELVAVSQVATRPRAGDELAPEIVEQLEALGYVRDPTP